MPMTRQSPVFLRAIGILKLVSACLLMAVGFGIFHLLGNDVGDTLEHFVRKLHLDPENKMIVKILADASGVSKKELRAIDAGTFIYALLYIVEGTGLVLAKHWAEYLTIIATALLVPFEIYEVAHKQSGTRIFVLCVNIAIVCYLLYQLRREQKEKDAEAKAKL